MGVTLPPIYIKCTVVDKLNAPFPVILYTYPAMFVPDTVLVIPSCKSGN